ncbi:stalk domain-containing protein [Paenibacillus sp. CAU 1782]
MKKVIVSILISAFFMSFINATIVFADGDNVDVYVDGSNAGTIPAPVISNGVLMFPFAEIFEAAGYVTDTQIDEFGLEATVVYTGLKYGARTGMDHFQVTDAKTEKFYEIVFFQTFAADIGTKSVGVPLDYFKYDIGLDVSWDAVSKIVYINTAASKPENVFELDENNGVFLKINDPRLFVSNFSATIETQVDPLKGATPVIKDGRTLLPIATLIEQLGGSVQWDAKERKVSITLNGNIVEVWIDKTKAIVNGEQKILDVSPTIMKSRTMVPLRFVTENLGMELFWDKGNQIIILYRPWFKKEMALDSEFYTSLFTSSEEVDQPLPDKPTTSQTPVSSPEVKPTLNTTDPLDNEGKLIHVTDIVSVGVFSGEVKQINGTKILVYWDTKSTLVPNGDEGFWASLSGIRYKANSWIEANKVSIVSSGF